MAKFVSGIRNEHPGPAALVLRDKWVEVPNCLVVCLAAVVHGISQKVSKMGMKAFTYIGKPFNGGVGISAKRR
jgi:hypothetical protein